MLYYVDKHTYFLKNKLVDFLDLIPRGEITKSKGISIFKALDP